MLKKFMYKRPINAIQKIPDLSRQVKALFYISRTKNMPFYERRRINACDLQLLLPFVFWIFRKENVMAGKLERDFQAGLIKELKARFPGSIVTKLDSSHIQGIPDLLILYKDRWATLECKENSKAAHRPNQDHYVDTMNEMSFSRFIFPENKEEVLNDLQQAFES